MMEVMLGVVDGVVFAVFVGAAFFISINFLGKN